MKTKILNFIFSYCIRFIEYYKNNVSNYRVQKYIKSQFDKYLKESSGFYTFDSSEVRTKRHKKPFFRKLVLYTQDSIITQFFHKRGTKPIKEILTPLHL